VPLVENLLLLWNMAHHNHIPRSLYTFVSPKMTSVKYTNYHNYLWSASGCVFVHFFLIVILFFKWLYHLLGVEFDKTNTANESKMVKIVGNRSDLVENESKIGWIGQKKTILDVSRFAGVELRIFFNCWLDGLARCRS